MGLKVHEWHLHGILETDMVLSCCKLDFSEKLPGFLAQIKEASFGTRHTEKGGNDQAFTPDNIKFCLQLLKTVMEGLLSNLTSMMGNCITSSLTYASLLRTTAL